MNITPIYTHPSRYLVRGAPTVAIILHEVNEPLGALGSRIGTNLINALKPTAHQSYHYAVDGAAVHSFVDPAMAARALGDTEILTGWSVQAGFVGVDPDKYTINIAVIVGSAPIGDNLCIPCCGREYSPVMMWNLRRLIHQLAETYDIDVSGNLLWLHGDELCDICLDDLRVPPEVVTPGEEDWLCDRLADLPISTEPPAALVGADCSVYVPAAIVTAGLCDALGDLPTGTVTAPAMCNELVVTPDCEVIPLDDGDWQIYHDPVTGACMTGRQTPFNNTASGVRAIAEGYATIASGLDSHSEGRTTQAIGTAAHAEGYETIASGSPSHAEGRGTQATSASAHAEGRDTIASGAASHAEGTGTTASAPHSHAEGSGSLASGTFAHAEGHNTIASGSAAHAEGEYTLAAGLDSHAQNRETDALGPYTDASGYQSRALVCGEAAQANGMFEFRGDAQKRTIHWMLDSLSQDANSYVPLIITGEPSDLSVSPGAVLNLHIQLVGATENAAQAWAFNIDAVVSNAGSVAVLAQTTTTLYASDAQYGADVFADAPDGELQIRVHKGATGSDYHVRWYAFAHIAQVIF